MMSLAVLLLATMAEQGPCEALKSLSIPNTTITASEYVPAGPQQNARGGQGAMSFDLDADLVLAMKNAAFLESTDPDLSKFKARGGKLLLYHGWADPGPAPENTINYITAVTKKLGGNQDDWMRLFLMPGVGHCRGGVGPDQADFLTTMENWREKGEAPGRIVASRNPGRGRTGMTRPLCPYPQVAKYTGNGSTDDAQNFVCPAR